MADPIHQFQLKTIVALCSHRGTEIVFTQSSLFMFGAVALITLFMLMGTASRALVPGRLQSMVEMILRIRRQHRAEARPAMRA